MKGNRHNILKEFFSAKKMSYHVKKAFQFLSIFLYFCICTISLELCSLCTVFDGIGDFVLAMQILFLLDGRRENAFFEVPIFRYHNTKTSCFIQTKFISKILPYYKPIITNINTVAHASVNAKSQ